MQIACSVRVPLCTCCALCAIKHMTQKHWCVHAAREREEGVKTHRYAVLKGCRERDIVRPPTPVQITPELPTVTVFYSRCKKFGRIPRKTVRWWRWWPQHRGGISLPRWSGNAVIVTALWSTKCSDLLPFLYTHRAHTYFSVAITVRNKERERVEGDRGGWKPKGSTRIH